MKKWFFLVAPLFLFMLCSCGTNRTENGETNASSAPDKDSYKKIYPEEAKTIIDQNPDCIILDVRTLEEYTICRVNNSILIPYDEIGSQIEGKISNKDALILIYCRTGRRSAIAAKEMIEMGYTNVYDFGGIEDWPYDTIDG